MNRRSNMNSRYRSMNGIAFSCTLVQFMSCRLNSLISSLMKSFYHKKTKMTIPLTEILSFFLRKLHPKLHSNEPQECKIQKETQRHSQTEFQLCGFMIPDYHTKQASCRSHTQRGNEQSCFANSSFFAFCKEFINPVQRKYQ